MAGHHAVTARRPMSKLDTSIRYRAGFVQSKAYLFALGVWGEFARRGLDSTECCRYERPAKKWANFDVGWSATRMWVHPLGREEVLVGPEGRYAVKTDAGLREGEIWPGEQGPEGLGDISDLRMVGDHLYAAGMCRQVYRRKSDGTWTRFDQGVVVKPSAKDVRGFNSIDGTSEKDIYAAGFGGEIWRWDGKKWRQIESPTNLILNRVRTTAKDTVYICGKMGALLRGHGDDWEVIEHDLDDELWDVEVFDNTVYVAADDCIYRLTDDDHLEPVEMKLKPKPTCGSLHAADGVLLSVGHGHVCWTEDGDKWHNVTP